MVELARLTGDIRQNVLVPDKLVFRHDAFWANHFGGTYVFVDDKITTVISDPAAPGFRRSRPWQVSYISIKDPAQIFDFLARTGRVELPRASWVEGSGLYAHRAEMAAIALAYEADPAMDFSRLEPVWLQTFIHRNAERVAREGSYPFLQEMIRAIGASGSIRIEDVDPARRFLLVRAKPEHRDQWLTNRLIAQLTPMDFVSRFIFDKQGFYDAYEGFSDGFREYVVSRLSQTYLKDKAGFRKRLYGIGEDDNA